MESHLRQKRNHPHSHWANISSQCQQAIHQEDSCYGGSFQILISPLAKTYKNRVNIGKATKKDNKTREGHSFCLLEINDKNILTPVIKFWTWWWYLISINSPTILLISSSSWRGPYKDKRRSYRNPFLTRCGRIPQRWETHIQMLNGREETLWWNISSSRVYEPDSGFW